MNYVQLTSKDLRMLKEGKSIKITIDGKARVNLRHCDCDICSKYSDQHHKVVEPSGELDDDDAGCFPPFVQNNQHDRRNRG
tara:strand:+ start:212 stop:454 length:243 start_codon:yes stop_codon:yes gene_type:complete